MVFSKGSFKKYVTHFSTLPPSLHRTLCHFFIFFFDYPPPSKTKDKNKSEDDEKSIFFWVYLQSPDLYFDAQPTEKVDGQVRRKVYSSTCLLQLLGHFQLFLEPGKLMIEIFTKLSILASNFSAGQQSRTVRLPLVFHFF